MLEIRGVRRDIIGGYTHMTASAMARTDISVTELVSHPEMLPLKELSELNKDDMSVTRLVSQVDMSPYLASAADASCKYS